MRRLAGRVRMVPAGMLAIYHVPVSGGGALGDLTFAASPDHATLTSYEARLYVEGTTTPVIDTLDLGLPTPSGGSITVNIATWLNSQLAGNYDVRVAAIGPLGTTESGASNSFTVPLV